MNMIARYLYVAFGAAIVFVTIGLLTSALPVLAPAPALLALLWGVGQWRGWVWVASVVLAGLMILAAAGILAGSMPMWMLLGAIAALAAWDLEHFKWRVSGVSRVEGESAFAYAHVRRLGLVLGLGLLLGLFALVWRVQLDLGWAIVLGLLAVISLGQAIRFLRLESD